MQFEFKEYHDHHVHHVHHDQPHQHLQKASSFPSEFTSNSMHNSIWFQQNQNQHPVVNMSYSGMKQINQNRLRMRESGEKNNDYNQLNQSEKYANLILESNYHQIKSHQISENVKTSDLIGLSRGDLIATASLQQQQLLKKQRQRRNRHSFNTHQTAELEKLFEQSTHYPDAGTIGLLSKQLKMPVSRIQIWFQNRRAKFRRNSNAT